MSIAEQALVLGESGRAMLAVLHQPPPADAAPPLVVVLPGAPQTRVGAGRLFVLWARAMSTAGIACLRFDPYGRGDSDGQGSHEDFDEVAWRESLTAVACWLAEHPGRFSRIVLLGLCDGASAAVLDVPSALEARVDARVLLNPWAFSPAAQARSWLWGYYWKRLLSAEFWHRLLGFKLNFAQSLRESSSQLRAASAADEGDLAGRLATALASDDRPCLLVLSGQDRIADMFRREVLGQLPHKACTRLDFDQSDHTFSAFAQRDALFKAVNEWVVNSYF